jgi:iron complex transport system ATP-binding protein
MELMSLFQVDSLSFQYRRTPVIDGLALTIDEGGVVALLGPNGSGKTTLLKLLLGLLKPSHGVIRLRGKDIGEIPRQELACQLAYVPQVHHEAFGFLVFDVVLMGRMPHSSFYSRYGDKDKQIVWDALEKLGILHLAKRPYTEISGGERQLTLIARALAQGARVFVMDEPTNGLDYGNQIRLLERVGRLADEGYTFIFTSHHPDHALAIADRVMMMQRGAIIHDGAPQAIVTPEGLAELYGLPAKLFHGGGNGACGMPMMRQRAEYDF